MPGKSRTEGTAVGIDKNTGDNDFLLAVSSGIICHYSRDLVTACKNTEDINDRKGLSGVYTGAHVRRTCTPYMCAVHAR